MSEEVQGNSPGPGSSLVSLSEIKPTAQVPSPQRMLLLKYERCGAVDTIAGMVVRGPSGAFPVPQNPASHPLVNAIPFGDGTHGVCGCPVVGAGDPIFDLPVFDPLPDGTIPDVKPRESGAFVGVRVWGEWSPYQAAKPSA